MHPLKTDEMNEEEIMLNGLLIDKCKEEGIMIALVAINRETKEIELPQSFKDMVNDPNYYICYCHRSEKGDRSRDLGGGFAAGTD